ncbi:MAG: 3-deoxy-D-manno-octulosonic acid transferase, partial [Planktotalea sp.]|uniref:3-deoxy-D-manno-octulosonic acid transferase n=1 Tax=Planktotalea sp. TaxID=2029877 RepID=UPI003C74CABC
SDIYLADTLGEMDRWYRACGICFVAGSLVPKGGHTPYEPAFYNCALLHGPHLENFTEPYAALKTHAGARLCANQSQIAEALIDLQDHEVAATLRQAASAALEKTTDLDAALDALARLSKT